MGHVLGTKTDQGRRGGAGLPGELLEQVFAWPLL